MGRSRVPTDDHAGAAGSGHSDEKPATPSPASSDDQAEHDSTGLDLARALTRSLRSASRGRRRPSNTPRRRDTAELSGAHPDGRDPALLGDAVEKLVTQSGWNAELAVRGVFARWDEIVGDEVASHCHPESFTDGRLKVRADSTAWATELKMQAPTVLRLVNEALGHGTVAFIEFSGPDGPSWAKGKFTTRGGRGPRDTYG
jgi:predicted nucleic acid-binding Zn ribbon protein